MKKTPVFKNRKAYYDYEILEKLECGIVLTGTEVKSLRGGKCSLEGSWVRINNDELWLIGCDVPEYLQGNYMNHDPKRDRKLLAHRCEIEKFAKKVIQKGFTLVPTFIYFNDKGKVKVEISVARGKQSFDKRESIKEREARRQMR